MVFKIVVLIPKSVILAVSIVVKGELSNETVNYDTKTKAQVPILASPVGTRPKMNVFCTFKIGPFILIKKDVFLTSFRRPENNLHHSSECVSIVISIHDEDC